MVIYLYVKTHNKTGLKYLGQTSASDPHKYTGSGIYWRNHLKIHGVDYKTEILIECQTKEEIKMWGIYYSNLWDIVNAVNENGKKIWANMKLEEGCGGGHTKWNEEQRKAISERRKGKPNPHKGMTYEEIMGPERAAEVKLKKKKIKPPKMPGNHRYRQGKTYEEIFGEERAKELRKRASERCKGDKNHRYGKPGTFLGRTHSEETRQKLSRPSGPMKTTRRILECPHCGHSCDASNAKRWHFDNCKLRSIE